MKYTPKQKKYLERLKNKLAIAKEKENAAYKDYVAADKIAGRQIRYAERLEKRVGEIGAASADLEIKIETFRESPKAFVK